MLANLLGRLLVSVTSMHEMDLKLTAQRMAVAMAWVE